MKYLLQWNGLILANKVMKLVCVWELCLTDSYITIYMWSLERSGDGLCNNEIL